MNSRQKHQRGMVMLEALLAIAIFSLVAGALLNISSNAMNQKQKLTETRCANWLADNLLVQDLLRPTVTMGETRGDAKQCDILWQWRIVRQKTSDERFWLLTLEVFQVDGRRQLQRELYRVW